MGVWHDAQPTSANLVAPVIPNRGVWGGGADSRWKFVWRSIACSPPAPAWSSGSATVSQSASSAWLPLGAFSAVTNRLVRPISLSDASAEKLSRLASCAFQPKRPTRGRASGGSSKLGTMCARPLMPGGGDCSRARMSPPLMASISPSPETLGVTRRACTSARGGTISWHSTMVALAWRSEPPRLASGSKGFPPLAALPKRDTRLDPAPPARGSPWQVEQLLSLKMGPRPSTIGRMRRNSTRPSSNCARSIAVSPGRGSPTRGWISCAEARPAPANSTDQARGRSVTDGTAAPGRPRS